MTADRDALAGIIEQHEYETYDVIADAIIAAGWQPPVTWRCGHPYRAGAWGKDGECIKCYTDKTRA